MTPPVPDEAPTHRDGIRFAVLLSGGGTTYQNLQEECAAGRFPGRIVGVIASRASAYGLIRARANGVPTEIAIDPWETVRRWRATHVLCAGWLRKLVVPADYAGKVLNIHPSLLPEFGGQGMYGHHVHEAVLAAGRTRSGCTVHVVDNEYDSGPILLQRTVEVLLSDTADTLAAKVQAAERLAYPEAIRRWLVSGEPVA